MKTSSFVANLLVWLAVGAAGAAFLVWTRTADAAAVQAALSASSLWQSCSVLAMPLMLYAIGAVLALIVVRAAKLHLSGMVKSRCFIVAFLILALLAAAIIPIIGLGPQAGVSVMTVIVVYATAYAPVVFPIGGIFYALGIAPIKQG